MNSPANIKEIVLGKDIRSNGIRPVHIIFEFPCTWTTLTIDNLKEIVRLWIKGEEEKYPLEEGFEGRWLLFKELKKVFDTK